MRRSTRGLRSARPPCSPRPARWSATATTTAATTSKRVVLVTHESFVLSKELQKQFEDESGYDLVVKASGDAGALTNKLVLTKDDPTGDAVFGIDNTFGSPRASTRACWTPYAATLPGRRRRLRPRRRRRPRPHPGRHRQRVRQRRRHLVRRPRRAGAADASTTWSSRRTRTCSSPRARRRARPGWPSCWPPSRRTARTAGRTTGPS